MNLSIAMPPVCRSSVGSAAALLTDICAAAILPPPWTAHSSGGRCFAPRRRSTSRRGPGDATQHVRCGARGSKTVRGGWLVGPGFVTICQCASQLHGIGTLLQPHDQPVLQCPHVGKTRGKPLAALSGTSRIAAEGDDVFA